MGEGDGEGKSMDVVLSLEPWVLGVVCLDLLVYILFQSHIESNIVTKFILDLLHD